MEIGQIPANLSSALVGIGIGLMQILWMGTALKLDHMRYIRKPQR